MGTPKATADHDEIREWVEARGGKPATLTQAEPGDERGALHIDFPARSHGDAFEEITWDEWFQQFDEKNLAALYDEDAEDAPAPPANPETSQVIRLVDRETVDARPESHHKE